MSNDKLLKIARRIMGARFLIIDEISLVGCRQLLKIDSVLRQVLIAWFYDPTRNRRSTNDTQVLKNIQNLPFGGLHVLFAGFLLININKYIF
jgi:hypothetical protein